MLILFRNNFTLYFTLILGNLMALELVELRVPTYVPFGAQAMLLCRWNLGSDVLYSVKWYKDSKEFFRHVPRDDNPQRKFLLPGVNVEVSDASGSNPTLASAVPETHGTYRCEVSGESPHFYTVSAHADMFVIASPKQNPSISGFKSLYYIGDEVNVNCTTNPSKQKTHLSWYVNGEPIDVRKTIEKENDRLKTGVNLGLQYKIEEKHMKGELKIKCIATSSLYSQSAEVSAIVATKPNTNIIQEEIERSLVANDAGKISTGVLAIYIFVNNIIKMLRCYLFLHNL